MKSKNLTIAFVWTFVIVMLVGLFWFGDVASAFNVGLIFFFIALSFTSAIVFGLKEEKKPENELLGELQKIRSKLDELASRR